MRDAELLARFEADELRSLTHEEHVRLARLFVLRDGVAGAIAGVSAGIRSMATANGKPDAFHATRTEAWIRLIAARPGEHADSEAFLESNPDLLRRDRLDDNYAAGRLLTDEARRAYVEPDRPFA